MICGIIRILQTAIKGSPLETAVGESFPFQVLLEGHSRNCRALQFTRKARLAEGFAAIDWSSDLIIRQIALE